MDTVIILCTDSVVVHKNPDYMLHGNFGGYRSFECDRSRDILYHDMVIDDCKNLLVSIIALEYATISDFYKPFTPLPDLPLPKDFKKYKKIKSFISQCEHPLSKLGHTLDIDGHLQKLLRSLSILTTLSECYCAILVSNKGDYAGHTILTKPKGVRWEMRNSEKYGALTMDTVCHSVPYLKNRDSVAMKLLFSVASHARDLNFPLVCTRYGNGYDNDWWEQLSNGGSAEYFLDTIPKEYQKVKNELFRSLSSSDRELNLKTYLANTRLFSDEISHKCFPSSREWANFLCRYDGNPFSAPREIRDQLARRGIHTKYRSGREVLILRMSTIRYDADTRMDQFVVTHGYRSFGIYMRKETYYNNYFHFKTGETILETLPDPQSMILHHIFRRLTAMEHTCYLTHPLVMNSTDPIYSKKVESYRSCFENNIPSDLHRFLLLDKTRDLIISWSKKLRGRLTDKPAVHLFEDLYPRDFHSLGGVEPYNVVISLNDDKYTGHVYIERLPVDCIGSSSGMLTFIGIRASISGLKSKGVAMQLLLGIGKFAKAYHFPLLTVDSSPLGRMKRILPSVGIVQSKGTRPAILIRNITEKLRKKQDRDMDFLRVMLIEDDSLQTTICSRSRGCYTRFINSLPDPVVTENESYFPTLKEWAAYLCHRLDVDTPSDLYHIIAKLGLKVAMENDIPKIVSAKKKLERNRQVKVADKNLNTNNR